MNKSLLEQLKPIVKTDIYHIVSEYIELSPRGKDYHGICVFCNSDAFTISPKYGMFHCFGCGKGGDAIAFLQQVTSKTLEEIIVALAQKYDLSL